MLAVFRRELRAYFTSPIGFTFVGFFLLIAGVFFAISNLLSGNPNYTGVLSSLTFVFLFLVPILTMRLLSEETRQKTDQLLITSPLSITGIVLGKYLAAVGVFLITLIITVLYPVIMSFFALGGLALVGDPRRLHRVLPPGLRLSSPSGSSSPPSPTTSSSRRWRPSRRCCSSGSWTSSRRAFPPTRSRGWCSSPSSALCSCCWCTSARAAPSPPWRPSWSRPRSSFSCSSSPAAPSTG